MLFRILMWSAVDFPAWPPAWASVYIHVLQCCLVSASFPACLLNKFRCCFLFCLSSLVFGLVTFSILLLFILFDPIVDCRQLIIWFWRVVRGAGWGGGVPEFGIQLQKFVLIRDSLS